jgi:crotonobetainyl-CoA:carnitine CoA-transferase CaiB-like acyl-CoA transferase
MVDSLFHFHDMTVHTVSMDRDAPGPIRQGRDFPTLSPAGTFRGPEGWIIILCTEWQMSNLWKAIGRPHLAEDPRFSSNPMRIENRGELTELIEEWLGSFETDAEALAALAEARVPSGPVLSPADALTHPHFVERNMVRQVEDPLAGTVTIPGFPWKSTDPLPEDVSPAAALGAHNWSVLGDLAGVSDDELTDLAVRGVIASKPH